MSPILVDTNVVLDAVLNREPFAEHAWGLFARIEAGRCTGVLSACSITTVYYYLRRAFDEPTARRDLRALSRLFQIQPVDAVAIRHAIERLGKDFEDDLIIESAVASGATAIVTRNEKDFRTSPVPAMTPGEWLAGS